jgi:hypothetical protein
MLFGSSVEIRQRKAAFNSRKKGKNKKNIESHGLFNERQCEL